MEVNFDNLQVSGTRITQHVISFGRVLRRAGLEIGTGQIMDALLALDLIGLRRKEDVYQALYSIFVTRQENQEIFNQAFEIFWRSPSRIPAIMSLLLPKLELPESARKKESLRVRQALAEKEKPESLPRQPREQEKKEVLDLVLTYSPQEVMRKKDFAEFSAEEVLLAKRFLSEMRWPLPPKHTRRRIPDAKGQLLDLRRTIRKSMRHQGEMVKLSWHGRNAKPRRLVIICDISGSMERYSRLLLHFMHTMTRGLQQVETFVFGTRLTRITRYLRLHDIDDAIRSVSRIVNDWAGGTKIGASLKEFNFLWARRVLRSGAVVMIISDGWDRGDIPLLKREMERLSKSCYRLLWLNPLLGYEDYEPLTQGIQTALPHIDHFLPMHNLESLVQLGQILASLMRSSSSAYSGLQFVSH
jgi:uncharacterized protein with von Willebrand factor type A (vWA) domain